MKQGKTREILQEEIKKAIYLLDNNAIQERIIKEVTKKGYSRGFISSILERNALLETLSLLDLGIIADAIYKISDINSTNLEIFFEEIEIEKIRRYKVEEKKEDKDLLVFENVMQVADDIWTVVVPCQRIAQLYRENAVGYDFSTQRESKNIKSKDTIIQTASVNWASVEEIKEQLVKGLFIPNTITFNIPIENAEDIKYDKNKKRLIILKKSFKILDGFHRSLGIIAALREIDLNYNFEVRITNFNTDKARQFIVQEDKRNPINKEYIKSIDTADRVTAIVNNLNQNNSSELSGMITTNGALVTSGDALINFSTMYEIINALWEPTTIVEANNISEYLKDFFNEIIGLYPNEFKLHIKESRKINNINKEQMFVLYLVLAKRIENNPDWKQILQKNIFNIIIKDNKDLVDTPPNKIKKSIKKYINISENIIGEVLNDEE